MMVMKVKLQKKELHQCSQAAALRWQLARASGVANQRKDGGRSDNEVDLLGIKAEVAVSKILSCDHNVFQLGVDDGADMFLNNISIDVKATFHENGKLLFKSMEAFKAHCAVLVTATKYRDVMSIVGFSPKTEFKKYAVKQDLGHGLCFTMDQKYLRPIENLWKRNQELIFESQSK
jgi:hypothetical protein